MRRRALSGWEAWVASRRIERDQPIQALAAGQAQGPGFRVAAQVVEQAQHLARFFVADLCEEFGRPGGVGRLRPDRVQLACDGRCVAFRLGCLEQHLEMAVDRMAVPVERGRERRGGVKPHGGGQARHPGIFPRHIVSLLVGGLLQAVLDVAQKHISGVEFAAGVLGNGAALRQNGEDLPDAALLQVRGHPAADQLKDLAEELDFADAARAELDVAFQALARHLLGDHQFHGAQGLEGAEVEVAAVDERLQPTQQVFPRRPVACHRARLDPGVAFPVAPLFLVVALQGVKAHDQGAVVAEGAQAQVHPEDEPVGRRVADDLDQLAGQAGEEIVVRHRPVGPAGFAGAGIGEDQIDVRGEVELAGPELAQPQDHERLRAAVGAGRDPLRSALPAVEPGQGVIQAGFGQGGEVGGGFGEVGQAGEVAPGDTDHLPAAETAQPEAEIFDRRDPSRARRKPGGVLPPRRRCAADPRCSGQVRQ